MIVPTGSKIHSSNKDDFSIQIQSVKWEMIIQGGIQKVILLYE